MLTVLSLFSGIGGIDLGLEATGGFRTVAFCEIDPFCREVLAKHWPEVPCHDDVRRLSVESVGRVDAIVGGFPCQPHSVAGKRKGREDERHLWPEFARLVREIRPRWVLAENVPGLRTTAADEVLGDLEAAGYSVWPLVVGADDVGAPHRRKRVWILAHRARDGKRVKSSTEWSNGMRTGKGRDEGLAHRDRTRQRSERVRVLLDGERAASGDDADGCGIRPVGHTEGDGGHGSLRDHEREAVREAVRPSNLRWPARPGEPQHEWEEPRLAYASSGRDERPGVLSGQSLQPLGGDTPEGLAFAQPSRGWRNTRNGRRGALAGDVEGDGTGDREGSRDAQQPLGSPAHGLPLDLVRLARRGNREALKAAGNSVVPQVVYLIGRAILAAEEELKA